MSLSGKRDVIVVGAGNAALCAALSAAENGASVTLLERAPYEARGGNSAYAGGAFRIAYNGVDDIKKIVRDLTDEQVETTDFGTYSEETYFNDLARLSQYQMDAELADTLVSESLKTTEWMVEKGVRFVPIYGRQAYKIDGRFKFWGGLTVEVSGGGYGLMDSLFKAAEAAGIEIIYSARAIELLQEGTRVVGARIVHEGKHIDLAASAVILASGGYHANAEWRARYLGKNWDLCKVRGSKFNTGDGIQMAIEAGAMPYGNWSGCHSVAYERNAPEFGEPGLLSQQKNGFPLGIIVNANGERFFDEGADFRNYIYSKLGDAILQQPDRIAWQIFDQKVTKHLNEEYRIRQITKVEANTLGELADKMGDVDKDGFLREMEAYNASIRIDAPFNPNIKDGRKTDGLRVPKSNWANRLDEPPYTAFAVMCGITFTYGGLRIDNDARVMTQEGSPLPGLYAAGELVGGLYYVNYPGGAGLTSGSVFGQRAGAHAAAYAAAYAQIQQVQPA